MIDRSSPVKQNIGDFVDEEEKILSLFKVTNIFARWQIFFQGDKYFFKVTNIFATSSSSLQGREPGNKESVTESKCSQCLTPGMSIEAVSHSGPTNIEKLPFKRAHFAPHEFDKDAMCCLWSGFKVGERHTLSYVCHISETRLLFIGNKWEPGQGPQPLLW